MYSYLAKWCILGDSTVGKTALLNRYLNNVFDPHFSSTIGVEFNVRTIPITLDQSKIPPNSNKNIEIKCQFWDTAGQERFAAIIDYYFRDVQVVLFVFDLTNPNSFESVKNRWWKRFNQKNNKTLDGNRTFVACLIGNKLDLVDPSSKTEAETESNSIEDKLDEEASNWANDMNIFYRKVSAKTGEGVIDCFNYLANDLAERIVVDDFECKLLGGINYTNSKLKLENNKKSNLNLSCCRGAALSFNN